jgi:hypothetical protein
MRWSWKWTCRDRHVLKFYVHSVGVWLGPAVFSFKKTGDAGIGFVHWLGGEANSTIRTSDRKDTPRALTLESICLVRLMGDGTEEDETRIPRSMSLRSHEPLIAGLGEIMAQPRIAFLEMELPRNYAAWLAILPSSITITSSKTSHLEN